MSARVDSSKIVLRAEFIARIRDAVKLRDWHQLQHWAKEWIQLDPRCANAFKWLARAALAQRQLKRAAYAYGRLLDIAGDSEEARNFFAKYPDEIQNQSGRVQRTINTASANDGPPEASSKLALLGPDDRRDLAQRELSCGQRYEQLQLFSEAAAAFNRSFEWHPNEEAALAYARNLRRENRGLEAVRFLRQQLFHFANWYDGRVEMGRILHMLGHVGDAQKEWQTVLKQDPTHKEALEELKHLLLA